MENSLIKVAMYIRVSTDKQAKTGDSMRDQQEVLKNYIDSHHNLILADSYIDEGI
jgi:DNA invertase Pin-like site-specific DNA recombinase